LLVVAILSSLALAATTFVDNADDQERFEVTRNRLENIRRAVAGYPGLSAGGEAVIGGFVADMGRLPRNLNELFVGGYCSNAIYISQTACGNNGGTWTPNPVFNVVSACSDITITTKSDCETGGFVWVSLGAGWRGPYLHTMPESGGTIYRDGWGNGASAPGADFGWSVAVTDIDGSATPDDFDDALTVRSTGSDGASGGVDYAADYPASGVALVERRDHHIDLTGGIRVRLVNPGDGSGCSLPFDGVGSCTPGSSASVCLRIYYASNGAISSVPSDPLTLTAGLVADGASKEVTFAFPTTGRQWVPWGVRAVSVFNYSGSCGDSAYPSATLGPAKTVALLPRTSLPLIEWRLE
jgi:hypothetical protein